MPFQPHGELTLIKEGRLLTSVRRGPFNHEFTMASERETIAAMAELNAAGPYAHLICYRKSAVSTAESVEYFRRKNTQPNPQRSNCVAVAAALGPEVEGRITMGPMIERYFATMGLPEGSWGVFDSEAEARAFVLAKLAEAGFPQD